MAKFLIDRSTRVVVLLAALVALIYAADAANLLRAAPAAPQAGSNKVYLPMVARSGGTTTPPKPTPTPRPNPTPTPSPVDESGALFMQPDQKTAGASLKV